MLEIDGTLIVLALSFIIFMFIMQAIFYGPMNKVREERSKYIDKNKELADRAQEDSQTLLKERDEKILLARKEATGHVSEEKQKAQRKKSELISGANTQAQDKLDEQKEILDKDRNTAREELKHDVKKIAHQISTIILGKEIPMSGISDQIVEDALNN